MAIMSYNNFLQILCKKKMKETSKEKKTFILINEGDVGMTVVNWSKKR